MFRKYKLKIIFVGLPVIVVVLWGLIPWSKEISLGDGRSAHITKASFVRSLWPEANSTIYYQPKDGRGGKIVLWQDVFDGPVMLLPTSDANALLCLYDFDVDFRLFRIDTGKVFKPVSPGSDLSRILFSSTWEIKDGTDADWQEVLNHLQSVSSGGNGLPTFPVGFRSSPSAVSLLKRLEYQGRKSEAKPRLTTVAK